LDIVEDSIIFVKNELKPELTFTWKSNNDHSETVEQNIKMFNQVNVILTKHESDPFKFKVEHSKFTFNSKKY
jgi:Txe/YoeB family toxin of Txe-Axe toxin-antitoxin module